MMDWAVNWWNGDTSIINMDSWGGIIAGYVREALLWLIELWHDWQQAFFQDWFDYCLGLIDMSGIPQLSALSAYILALNAWVPVDLGLKMFAAYVQIVVALAAFRAAKSFLGF